MWEVSKMLRCFVGFWPEISRCRLPSTQDKILQLCAIHFVKADSTGESAGINWHQILSVKTQISRKIQRTPRILISYEDFTAGRKKRRDKIGALREQNWMLGIDLEVSIQTGRPGIDRATTSWIPDKHGLREWVKHAANHQGPERRHSEWGAWDHARQVRPLRYPLPAFLRSLIHIGQE